MIESILENYNSVSTMILQKTIHTMWAPKNIGSGESALLVPPLNLDGVALALRRLSVLCQQEMGSDDYPDYEDT